LEEFGNLELFWVCFSLEESGKYFFVAWREGGREGHNGRGSEEVGFKRRVGDLVESQKSNSVDLVLLHFGAA